MGGVGPTRYSLCGALSVADFAPKPACDCAFDRSAAPERMRSGDRDHGASRPGWGHSERITLALDDQRRDGDGVELLEPALLRAARRVDGKREAEHGRG